MSELLTAAQMREIEQAAIESGAVTGLELMERAGEGVVEAILAEWPEFRQGRPRAVILCGPGNNGGDGFVIARLLNARNWQVEVFFSGDPAKLPPDARNNYERWIAIGPVLPLTHQALARSDAAGSGSIEGVVVDALFGTGLTRPLDPEVALALSSARSVVPLCWLKFVAVDCLSGVCSDSGRLLGKGSPAEFCFELCVTFHRLKTGHVQGDFAQLAGKVVVVDIGLDTDRGDTDEYSRLISGCGTQINKAQAGAGHKYDHGHAIVVSGGVGQGGAARMAARGALRIGAGLVTLACPPVALIENAAQVNAIMLRGVKDGAALSELLSDRRVSAVGIGPALGLDSRAADLLEAVLEAKHPAVLDADALTLLARAPALFAALHEECVLTPHAGEFARLFPDLAQRLQTPATQGPAYSKRDAARDAAKRAGCIVLFKGADTVIAHPDGRCSIHAAIRDRASPWLATAGSGDVLTGFIAGLLARGIAPMEAAESATWLHVECALTFGPGLIAEDLADELPKVFKVLGADLGMHI